MHPISPLYTCVNADVLGCSCVRIAGCPSVGVSMLKKTPAASHALACQRLKRSYVWQYKRFCYTIYTRITRTALCHDKIRKTLLGKPKKSVAIQEPFASTHPCTCPTITACQHNTTLDHAHIVRIVTCGTLYNIAHAMYYVHNTSLGTRSTTHRHVCPLLRATFCASSVAFVNNPIVRKW